MPYSICNLNPIRGGELIQIEVDGSADNTGNLSIYTPSNEDNIASVFFIPKTGSYDGLITPFISVVTNKLYLHCANFNGASIGGARLYGTCNIIIYKK